MMRLTVAAVLAATVVATPTNADTTGMARVIDGDTLVINSEHIRINGIDAPEVGQTCTAPDGVYYCGRESRSAMGNLVYLRPVSCEGSKKDSYGRTLATCYVGVADAREDLGATMVALGQAMAYRQYSTAYVPQEDTAKCNRIGMWNGAFLPPWEWRKGKR